MANAKNDYIKLLSKVIFWDTNIGQLDYNNNKQTIIERIAVYGNENDEKIMHELYPLSVIKKILVASDSLNEDTLQYYSFLLNVKEEKFNCYSRLPVQWSF